MSAEPVETLSQRELRNESGRVLRDVASGRSFVITNGGVPVARLSPLSEDVPSLPITRPAQRRGGWSALVPREQPKTPVDAVLDEMREDRM